MVKTVKIPEAKKNVIKEFVKLAKEYPIVGAVNMENLPTKQLQNMRAQLRETVVLRMSKRRLMKLALEQAAKEKPGVEKLILHLKGMPALLFTKKNPFSLYKTLQKNKSTAPIKAGQTAPNKIIVPAGPTGFAPGPIIGQLGQAGIAAGIENGKVAIKKDSEVAKEGDTISADLAGILTRLGIEPMEIGLDLVATYEDGNIFTKDVLAIDEQEYIANVTNGHRWAFNLAMECGILTKETTIMLITKAFTDAKALATSQDIYADTVMPELLSKAHNQMLSLKAKVPES
ncbi:50S ribosomal protein L10 [Candidatus Woesearchaeota archaeon]|nr:50S ribosomal protein L10 [Candidatus Woesearchaeota archaeon]